VQRDNEHYGIGVMGAARGQNWHGWIKCGWIGYSCGGKDTLEGFVFFVLFSAYLANQLWN
jgi:hypothetical protein